MYNSFKRKPIWSDCKRDHYVICLYNLNAVYSILFAEKANEGETSTLAVFFAYVGSELEWPRNIQNEKMLSLEKSEKLSEDTEEIPFVSKPSGRSCWALRSIRAQWGENLEAWVLNPALCS